MKSIKRLRFILSQLQELIDFGYESINKIKIHDTRKDSKKTILFETMGAIHKYSAAILQLCRCGFTEPGLVLLRCVIEANINFQYIMTGQSDEKAIGFLLDDSSNRIKWAENMLEFKKKYPAHQARILKMIENEEKLKKLIDDLKNDPQRIEKINKKAVWEQNLKNRALYVDKQNKNGDLEFLYLTVYWYFSHFAHLTARGLNNFLKEKTDGIFFKIQPSIEGVEKLAISTYINYLGFLSESSIQFEIPAKKDLQKFEKIFENLS